MRTFILIIFLFILVSPVLSQNANLDKTGTLWSPYLEWSLPNATVSGNPYDLVATATFVHESSGAAHETEMFYAGDALWRFRFTGTRTGNWTVTTASDDPDLDGHTGTVTINPHPDPNTYGFVTQVSGSGGTKWARFKGNERTREAFIPQFVMYERDPAVYRNNPAQIDADMGEFLENHGFTGLHVPHVAGRWFDLDGDEVVQADYQNPDARTFEALEQLITRVHNAGGVVHIWTWGDQQRRWSPIELPGGINGPEDRRLQRYIAARLGPLPGWTMGYGFDLDEWVTGPQLQTWREFMQQHLGWVHYLGGRPAGPNRSTNHVQWIDWNEAMDYSSYEHHEPSYEVYTAALQTLPAQPVFSEDRFRIRGVEGPEKNYTMEQTRRGLWISAMAGGVANIWGNLTRPSCTVEPVRLKSHPYPRPQWIKTAAEFFQGRFLTDMQRANDLTDGVCLKDGSNTYYLFYKQDTDSLTLDLSQMQGAQPAVAVDAKAAYAEIDLGTLQSEQHTWAAPYVSDWGIAVGTFQEETGNILEIPAFTASVAEDEVILTWRTSSPQSLSRFEVERATAPTPGDWKQIAVVTADDTQQDYTYRDENLSAGEYRYRIKIVGVEGAFEYSSAIQVSVAAAVEGFQLQRNYPNPFNPDTYIRFSILETSHVALSIFNISGTEIRTLLDESLDPGSHTVVWNGNNNQGDPAASGVYFYRLEAGDVTRVRKMTLLR